MIESACGNAAFVFIVGASRSGNTMIARMLGRHSEICTFRELHFFDQLWVRSDRSESTIRIAATLYSIQRKGYLEARDLSAFNSEAAELRNGVPPREADAPSVIFRRFLLAETQRKGKRIPCEHTPFNVFYLEEILRYFPGARIINMVRDPRGVLLSQKNRWRRRKYGDFVVPMRQRFRQKANYHPVTIGHLWKSSIRAARRHGDDKRVLTLHFEWCVADGERLARTLCNFLEVKYEPEMLQIPLIGSSVLPDRHDQSGIDASRASAWRNGGLTTAEIRLCQRVSRHELLAAGYEVEPVRGGIIRAAGLVILWPLQILIAFMFNLQRSKYPLDALKRRLRRTAR